MAARRSAVAESVPLLLEVEPEIPPAPPQDGASKQALRPVLAVGALNPPMAEAPASGPVVPPVVEPETLIDARVQVSQGKWRVEVVAVGEGGEILDEFTREGLVHANGVQHPGWVLAGVDVLGEIHRRALPGKLQIRIGDPKVVGFLVVTIRTRNQVAKWDQDAAAQPFPALYQEYLDLVDQLQPRIIWDPKA